MANNKVVIEVMLYSILISWWNECSSSPSYVDLMQFVNGRDGPLTKKCCRLLCLKKEMNNYPNVKGCRATQHIIQYNRCTSLAAIC